MLRISIDTDVLVNASQGLKAVGYAASHAADSLNSVRCSIDWQISASGHYGARLAAVEARLVDQQQRVEAHRGFLAATAARMDSADGELVRRADRLGGGMSPAVSAISWPIPQWAWMLAGVLVPGAPFALGLALYGIFGGGERSWGSDSAGGSVDYLGSHSDEWGSKSWYLARSEAHAKHGPAYAGVSAELGSAKAEFTPPGIKITEDKFEFGTRGELSVAAVTGSAKSGLGDRNLGVEAEASGSLGKANVEGFAGVQLDKGKVNAGLKADIGVAAAEGEVGGSFKIFGLEIGGAVEGKAGAVGAEGVLGVFDGKWECGFGAALGLGGGWKISIGLAK